MSCNSEARTQLSKPLFKSNILYIAAPAKESSMSSILGSAAESHIDTAFRG